MKLACLLVLLGVTSACGGAGVDVQRVVLRLPLDFEANDQLEVSVFKEETANCNTIEVGTVDQISPREGREFSRADGLNDGAVNLRFPDLPAEVQLTFYARVLRISEPLASDCVDGIEISDGGNVSVELTVEE